jgi:hypothetical protein
VSDLSAAQQALQTMTADVWTPIWLNDEGEEQ